jgi:hypothetical protein
MPEQGARTLGTGKYCKMVCKYILQAWNTDIPLIVELPVGFLIANTGASDKNGVFGHRCSVLPTK